MAISGFDNIKKVSFEDEYNDLRNLSTKDDEVDAKEGNDKSTEEIDLFNDVDKDESVTLDNDVDKSDLSSPSERRERETKEENKEEPNPDERVVEYHGYHELELSPEDKQLLAEIKKWKEMKKKDPELGLNNKQKIAKRELDWHEGHVDLDDLFDAVQYDSLHQKIQSDPEKWKGYKREDMDINSVRKKQMVDYLSDLMEYNPNLPSIQHVQKTEAAYLLDTFFKMLEAILEKGAKPGTYLNFKRSFQGFRKLNIGETIYRKELKPGEVLLQTPKIVLSTKINNSVINKQMSDDIVDMNGNEFIKVVEKDGKYVGYKSGIVYNDDLNKKLLDDYVERFQLQRTIVNRRSTVLDSKKK